VPHFEPELLGRACESVHLEALSLRYGPPCPWGGGGDVEGRWGDSQGGWGSRVHDPMLWARGHFPDVHSYFWVRRESVEATDRQLGSRVREVITPYVGMGSDFVQGCAVSRQPPFF
jgi:hypothetical protein